MMLAQFGIWSHFHIFCVTWALPCVLLLLLHVLSCLGIRVIGICWGHGVDGICLPFIDVWDRWCVVRKNGFTTDLCSVESWSWLLKLSLCHIIQLPYLYILDICVNQILKMTSRCYSRGKFRSREEIGMWYWVKHICEKTMFRAL